MVKIKKDINGKEYIILEEGEGWRIEISVERFLELKEAILLDMKDMMGWGKYKKALKELRLL